jgi:hypothetical protein
VLNSERPTLAKPGPQTFSRSHKLAQSGGERRLTLLTPCSSTGRGVTFSVDVMVLSFPPAQMIALPRILVRKP